MDRKVAGITVLAGVAFSCGGPRAQPPARSAPPPTPAPQAPASAPAAPAAPAGYLQMTVAGVGPSGDGSHVVLLVDDANTRLLPLAIGGTEAASIALRHAGETFARPLTHDLFDSALHALGARVDKVQIDELRDGVFRGRVFIRQGARLHALDARPSDAIALALGGGVPIYVAESVVAAGGIRAEELPQEAPSTMPPPRDLPPPPPAPQPQP